MMRKARLWLNVILIVGGLYLVYDAVSWIVDWFGDGKCSQDAASDTDDDCDGDDTDPIP